MSKLGGLMLCFITFLVLSAPSLQAATYYIDNSNGTDENPGTIELPWKTITKANSTLKAGDIVYLRAGVYTAQQINPENSGTLANNIMYGAYPGEAPIVSGGSTQISLSSKSYIKIKGIKFYYPTYRWAYISGSNHLYFENCTFDYVQKGISYNTFRIINSSYLQFVDTSWSSSGLEGESDQQNDMVSMSGVTHTLYLRCIFGDASHASVTWDDSSGADYAVFRDCIYTNRWRSAQGTYHAGQSRLLWEGNSFRRIGWSNDTCPWAGDRGRVTPGLYLSSSYCIVRENEFYGCDTGINPSANYVPVAGNWIYHNTIYDTDRTNGNGACPDGTTCAFSGAAIYGEYNYGYAFNANHIMNNIMWKIEGTNKDTTGNHIQVTGTVTSNVVSHNIIGDPSETISVRWSGTRGTVAYVEDNHSDWEHGTNSTSDPLFTAPDSQDFTLQPGSPAINTGTYMTLTNGSGSSSTSLVCENVDWAFSGPNSPWNIEHPDILTDRIYFQQPNGAWVERNVAGLNYATKSIILSLPASWDDNTPIYYKKFNGFAPDIGAYEYGTPTSTLDPPRNLKVILAP